MTTDDRTEVAVIGAGPAGVFAALQAAQLGARTVLLTRQAVGGMAATDGPVPVRALAQAARLRREARHLDRYGVAVGDIALIMAGSWHGSGRWSPMWPTSPSCAESRSPWRGRARAGGHGRLVEPHTVASQDGTWLHADKFRNDSCPWPPWRPPVQVVLRAGSAASLHGHRQQHGAVPSRASRRCRASGTVIRSPRLPSHASSPDD